MIAMEPPNEDGEKPSGRWGRYSINGGMAGYSFNGGMTEPDGKGTGTRRRVGIRTPFQANKFGIHRLVVRLMAICSLANKASKATSSTHSSAQLACIGGVGNPGIHKLQHHTSPFATENDLTEGV